MSDKEDRLKQAATTRTHAGEMSEAEIDYNVMGSFPASDPPSWTLGCDSHQQRPDEEHSPQTSPTEPTHQNDDASQLTSPEDPDTVRG